MPGIPVIPVILCGGFGTRLWPLSRSSFPKQFLVLSDDDSNQSLFQQAIERINSIGISDGSFGGIAIGPTLIVTNEEHRFLALDQLRELNGLNSILLLEPVGRNTAPALTLAAIHAQHECGEGIVEHDPILVITPADQTIQNHAAFVKSLKDCVAVVNADQTKKTIAILGILPTAPETGYGYIKRRSASGAHHEYTVERFIEKPNVKAAEEYLTDGNYLWNSGMFVMYASTWITALSKFYPDILSATEDAWIKRTTDQQIVPIPFIRADKEAYKKIPWESIDYAVIEKCPGSEYSVKMIQLDAGWSDLGAWDSVWQAKAQDENGNVTTGDILMNNTKNSLIHSSGRLVSAVGVENLIIIETADAVLVANRGNSQDVRYVVDQLEGRGREEKNIHRKVARPWGWYDNIDEGERFKVKRIQVKPGASLSLQMHYHRAEHWVIVRGTAKMTSGSKTFTLDENQSIYIPQGQIHQLTNPGIDFLEIIEIQTGSHLSEDDIIRLRDVYGR